MKLTFKYLFFYNTKPMKGEKITEEYCDPEKCRRYTSVLKQMGLPNENTRNRCLARKLPEEIRCEKQVRYL